MRIKLALALALMVDGATTSLVLAQDASAVAPPPAAPLTGASAWDRLKGNTITGKIGGQPFSEFFDAGGAVKYVDKDGLSTGTWAVQGTKICFDFPEDDDRSCSTFTVTGNTGTASDEDGVVVHYEIEAGNAKGL